LGASVGGCVFRRPAVISRPFPYLASARNVLLAPYLTISDVRPTVIVMEKTSAQLKAELITRGNIANLQTQFDAETNEGKRKWLGILLTEQRALITPD
jgi:hypothetical protein